VPHTALLVFNAIFHLSHGDGFAATAPSVRIRITRKLAQALNGLDLRPFSVGAIVDLDEPLAQMLIAERWAEEAVPIDVRAIANDAAFPTKRRHRGPPDGTAATPPRRPRRKT
jgi:hypothetical protein